MAQQTEVINGQAGERIADTDHHIGNWSAIYCLADTVFATLTGSLRGTVTGVTFEKGVYLYGRFKAIDLTSGSIIAYDDIE